MEVGFKEAEAILATRYGFDKPSIAFRGRLQHLQRGGFPEGVNTGKGRPAVYGWSQLLQLAVALDLIDVGLTPEAAKQLIGGHLPELIAGAASVGVTLGVVKLAHAAQSERCPFSSSVFVVTSANALTTLSGAQTGRSLYVLSGNDLVEALKGDNPYEVSATYVDLGTRLMLMLNQMALLTSRDLRVLADDYVEWASANVLNP